jgi:hypothetical protein
MPVTINGNTGIQFPDSSLQAAAASPYVLKNRIINGDMRIDQRNAGASVAVNNSAVYTVDRWTAYNSNATSRFTAQQNAGSVTPPTGFKNYLGFTVTSAYTVSGSDEFTTAQRIEGFNTADLAWGTANAQTVTLSFWVRSSLTGNFSVSLRNVSGTRSYPVLYSISSANTWEYKTITVAGETTGTWTTDNSTGLSITFGLGVGSTLSGTSGTWASSNFSSATGATSVVGTSGATLYITGVQLEIGSSATPFERRLYNQELANCQRYYQKSYSQEVTPGTITNTGSECFYAAATGGETSGAVHLVQSMRATVTATPYSTGTGASGAIRNNTTSADQTSGVVFVNQSDRVAGFVGGSRTATNTYYFHWTASAEL